MRKRDEIDRRDSCLNRSQDDEPLFVVCARDELGAETVRFWARRARELGVNAAKVEDADRCALDMDTWPVKKLPD